MTDEPAPELVTDFGPNVKRPVMAAEADRIAAAPAPEPEPEHVCGLQGFGALGDVCPACERNANRAAHPAPVAAPDADAIMQRVDTLINRAVSYGRCLVARHNTDLTKSELDEAESALRAAVERLVKELADVREMDSRAFASWQKERDKLQERAERAEQEHQFQAALVKELLPYQERAVRAEQDAARYRWLRGGSDIPAHSVRWGRWEINCWQGANGWQNLLCSELDAAIDAAIKGSK